MAIHAIARGGDVKDSEGTLTGVFFSEFNQAEIYIAHSSHVWRIKFLRKSNGGKDKPRNVDTNIVTRSGRAPKPTQLRLQKFLEWRNEKRLHGMSYTGSMETPDYGSTGCRNI